MKRIIISLAFICFMNGGREEGSAPADKPCGWCTCTSLSGGHYDLTGGANGKTVTLTGGKA